MSAEIKPGIALGPRLSKMLWNAQEAVEMYADVVESQSGMHPSWLRELRYEISAFRKDQGWSDDGFGGESDDLHRHMYVRTEGTNAIVCKCESTLYEPVSREGIEE